MGIYATVLDIERTTSKEILQQLTDDEDNGQVNNPVVEESIRQAEGLVNAALSRGGYVVPVALPIPAGAELVHSATVWLAT